MCRFDGTSHMMGTAVHRKFASWKSAGIPMNASDECERLVEINASARTPLLPEGSNAESAGRNGAEIHASPRPPLGPTTTVALQVARK